MKRFLTKITFLALLSNFLLIGAPAYAATTEIFLDEIDSNDSFDVGQILSVNDNAGDGTDDEEQGQSYLQSESPVAAFILDIINFITKIIGTIAMVLIIVGGLMMIVSQGEEHLLQKGKDTLTTAIFGLVISMFAYIIVRFVQSLFYLTGS